MVTAHSTITQEGKTLPGGRLGKEAADTGPLACSCCHCCRCCQQGGDMLCWRNPCSLWLLNALALSLSGGALARPCLLWKACLSPGDPLALSSSPRSEAAAPAPHLTALPVTASHCLATVWLLHRPPVLCPSCFSGGSLCLPSSLAQATWRCFLAETH